MAETTIVFQEVMVLLHEIELVTLAAVAASLTLSIVVLFKLRSISKMLGQKSEPTQPNDPKIEPKLVQLPPEPLPSAEDDDALLNEFIGALDSGTDLSTAARIFNMTEDEARVADLCHRELEAETEKRLAIS
jgi:hypothetical protein